MQQLLSSTSSLQLLLRLLVVLVLLLLFLLLHHLLRLLLVLVLLLALLCCMLLQRVYRLLLSPAQPLALPVYSSAFRAPGAGPRSPPADTTGCGPWSFSSWEGARH